ncbi:MAG: class I SAM-dependent methyltransferase [Candidatus Hydrogenedentes bacterium]|nr:class I SAM-dependent methyltransferase [Candidatus Hydrogenedentota bacterium]
MSSWSHWSARYAFDRFRLSVFEWRNPDAPWLTPVAIAAIQAWLRPHHVALEYGSGRSTLWIARRVARLTSVEHDPKWHTKITVQLKEKGVANVTQILRDAQSDAYLDPILELPESSLDFALIDGLSDRRDVCAVAVLDKLKPGSMLVIDDSHRYLSYATRAPLALGPNRDPLTETWRQFDSVTQEWPRTLTSSGVTDTLMLHRPDPA